MFVLYHICLLGKMYEGTHQVLGTQALGGPGVWPRLLRHLPGLRLRHGAHDHQVRLIIVNLINN